MVTNAKVEQVLDLMVPSTIQSDGIDQVLVTGLWRHLHQYQLTTVPKHGNTLHVRRAHYRFSEYPRGPFDPGWYLTNMDPTDLPEHLRGWEPPAGLEDRITGDDC